MFVRKYLPLLRMVFVFSIVMFVICGLIYPGVMTLLSQAIFPRQANGSLIYNNGKPIGSVLIGQDFTDLRFMKCRPSAVNYNTYISQDVIKGKYRGLRTGSDNYSAANPNLALRVKNDMKKFLDANPTIQKKDIPTDLLTASGSGLDPHISFRSAKVQIPGLANKTGLSEKRLLKIVENNTKDKLLGVFGEKTVNVLGVNLEIAKALNIIGE